MAAATTNSQETTVLVVEGSVDYKNCPVLKSASGGWRSSFFIIAVEVAERFAYYGISANLITYLTGSLHESTATAAANINLWSGVALLLPLLGGFVADSFLGQYRTIVISSLIYILGLGLLTLLAVINHHDCNTIENNKPCSPPKTHTALFYLALYLVAIGQGGHKPCVQAFGANQFDERDPIERKSKSSFFNWWYFCLSVGVIVTILVLVYIQDNLSWSLGFGIPCIGMIVALVIFLLGTTGYRFSLKENGKHPFARIGLVFVAAIKNRKLSYCGFECEEQEAYGSSQQFKFLNKALLKPAGLLDNERKVYTISDVEEAKAMLRLIPIWFSSLGYAIVFAQTSTFFTKQGATLNRKIFTHYEIPPASLQSFIGFSIILLIPIYDRVLVPISRTFTKKPRGITMLQRIGTGMVLSTFSMVISALVEMKRLKIAKQNGLIDTPKTTVPMTIWWLVPQYFMFGAADVFTIVGLQEFFYDQVPNELRSMGLSFYLSVLGVGSLLSSLLVSVINKASNHSWFNNNLNQAHLSNFYWLLAALSVFGFVLFLCFAKHYVYKRQMT